MEEIGKRPDLNEKNTRSKAHRDTLLIGVLYLCILILGFCAHILYDDFNNRKDLNERNLNGLYIYNSENKSSAEAHAYSREVDGDWVCINVAYDMSYKEAYKTCSHECSHKAFSEIYAEKCQDDITKCIEELPE